MENDSVAGKGSLILRGRKKAHGAMGMVRHQLREYLVRTYREIQVIQLQSSIPSRFIPPLQLERCCINNEPFTCTSYMLFRYITLYAYTDHEGMVANVKKMKERTYRKTILDAERLHFCFADRN
jgi:hypothetical protein